MRAGNKTLEGTMLYYNKTIYTMWVKIDILDLSYGTALVAIK
jgi:hypothetical protein